MFLTKLVMLTILSDHKPDCGGVGTLLDDCIPGTLQIEAGSCGIESPQQD